MYVVLSMTSLGRTRMSATNELKSQVIASSSPASAMKVGLVQINNSFSGQNYLPYSVALLQTYVQKNAQDPSRFRFLPSLYNRVRIADAVESLLEADLVGFRTSEWTGRMSLDSPRRVKAP